MQKGRTEAYVAGENLESRGYDTNGWDTSSEKSLWRKCLWDQPCFVFTQSVYSGFIRLQLGCGIALVQMEAEKEKMRKWNCIARVDLPWSPSQPQIHDSLSSMSHGEPGKKHKLPRYFLGFWRPCVIEIRTVKGALVKKREKFSWLEACKRCCFLD